MESHSDKKIFGIREFTGLVDKAVYTMSKFKKELKLVEKNFESHIMLAVSEVNGCRICSYLHTKQALESGSTEEEIAQFLGGDLSAVDKEEAVALVFAQHYADSSGAYEKEAFDRVLEAYGTERAYGILGNIRLIMMGNAHGITLGFLNDRIRGKRNAESSLLNELIVILSVIVLIPVLLIKNLFARKEAMIELA